MKRHLALPALLLLVTVSLGQAENVLFEDVPAEARVLFQEAPGPVLGPDPLTASERSAMMTEITRYQAEADRLGHKWTAGETGMMRLSPEERLRRRMKDIPPPPDPNAVGDYIPQGITRDGALDWRNNDGDFVTGIRSQGDCGSCWDFAALGTLESAFLIEIGGGNVPDFDLSEQNVLSCLDDYGYWSDCNGGQEAHAYWFCKNIGVLEECCVPYTADDSQPCGDICNDPYARTFEFGNYGYVCYSLNITLIKDALENRGPVSTSMTTYDSFDAYSGGVYQASGVVTGAHAVVIIGYNDAGQYWIAKNSWGDDWGMAGYFYIAWASGCGFGNYTQWAEYNTAGTGPFACMKIEDNRPPTGEPIWFWDRSVGVTGDIVSWEWDFDGDGSLDATGQGPHEHIFSQSGTITPRLTVTDADGQEDTASMLDYLQVIFNGPVWIVDVAEGSDYGDGSPLYPLMRIQMALNVANDGDTILVKPGTYEGLMNTELTPYGKSVVLIGDGEPGEIILDGGGAERLFALQDGEDSGFRVENITMRNGYHASQGGILSCDGASPVFADCRFEDGSTGVDVNHVGGAVWSNAQPTFEDCVFSGNSCGGIGGAIYIDSGVMTLDGCEFDTNTSPIAGGAIAVPAGSLLVADGIFLNNQSETRGGAIDIDAGWASIDRTVFEDNLVTPYTGGDLAGGGAVSVTTGGWLEMSNILLSGNQAPMGGGLYFMGTSGFLTHLTAWGNVGDMAGGAIVLMDGDLEVGNSIFWMDTAPDFPEIMAPGANLTLRYCDVQGGGDGEAIIDDDPLFTDAAAGDFRLVQGTPCAEIGDPSYGVILDIENLARPMPQGTAPDLGAYELQISNDGSDAAEDGSPEFRFLGIYPNPFNPTTTVAFELPRAADVHVEVFLPTGRRVADLIDESLGAGQQRVTWTAEDENGQPLASGLFLVRVDCLFEDGTRAVEIHKALLVK